MLKELTKLRKELHQNPELSGKESDTANRIQSFIKAFQPTEIISNLGDFGFAVVYEFSQTGPTIAIRCELDALPIQEENQFAHRSKVEGVSHKCGHDGHSTIVVGLIFWLKKQKFKHGKIILLFQSAEETGKGAFRMLEDERFAPLGIDLFFALHNIPGAPMHDILLMNQGFSAEVISFSIKLKGKESHASEPENGSNPAVTIAQLISEFSNLNFNHPEQEDFAVLTPVHLKMGEKSYGISPADGELHYTIRTWTAEKMEILKTKIEHLTKEKAKLNHLNFEIDWFEYFPAAQNNMECNQIIRKAAEANGFNIVEKTHPFRFGEDFGWFSQQYKVGMFGLGAGESTPALHSNQYDFPDELIPTGLKMFQTVLKLVLDKQQ